MHGTCSGEVCLAAVPSSSAQASSAHPTAPRLVAPAAPPPCLRGPRGLPGARGVLTQVQRPVSSSRTVASAKPHTRPSALPAATRPVPQTCPSFCRTLPVLSDRLRCRISTDEGNLPSQPHPPRPSSPLGGHHGSRTSWSCHTGWPPSPDVSPSAVD